MQFHIASCGNRLYYNVFLHIVRLRGVNGYVGDAFHHFIISYTNMFFTIAVPFYMMKSVKHFFVVVTKAWGKSFFGTPRDQPRTRACVNVFVCMRVFSCLCVCVRVFVFQWVLWT